VTDEERATAQLLRLAGSPLDPPAERRARVRPVVHQEWRASHRQRMIHRRIRAAVGLLALAAALVTAVWLNRPLPRPARAIEPVVAAGQRIQGQPLVLRENRSAGVRQPLVVSTSIHRGDVIVTDSVSRAAVRAADGSSVRIDRGSRVRFLARNAIEVVAGAAYIATSAGSRGFEARTPAGIVRDVGTQFELRVTASSLRLRVRAGRVEIQRGPHVTTAESGTEAVVTKSSVVFQGISTFGSEWAWMADLAPSFAIEGQPLRTFLEHIAGEQGWIVRYADPDVAAAAGRIILHGSIDGLRPSEALHVALATSGLQYRLRGADLVVTKPANAQ
jgi:ferric-dicitrate binding protein FerR (iron transport regulator)